MKPDDLITCCRAYCGTCARWHEHTAVRDCAGALAAIVDGHGFHRWMPREVKDFDYAEFRKGLGFLGKENTWLVCRAPCRRDPEMARCRFRQCCERRGVELCFDCDKLPCERVNKPMIERAKEYRKLGRRKWLRQLVEKARQGFELHTNKCYCTSVTEFRPPRGKPR